MEDEREGTRKLCLCPYCAGELDEPPFPFCQACQVEVFYCQQCGTPLPREEQACPGCGAFKQDEKTAGGE